MLRSRSDAIDLRSVSSSPDQPLNALRPNPFEASTHVILPSSDSGVAVSVNGEPSRPFHPYSAAPFRNSRHRRRSTPLSPLSPSASPPPPPPPLDDRWASPIARPEFIQNRPISIPRRGLALPAPMGQGQNGMARQAGSGLWSGSASPVRGNFSDRIPARAGPSRMGVAGTVRGSLGTGTGGASGRPDVIDLTEDDDVEITGETAPSISVLDRRQRHRPQIDAEGAQRGDRIARELEDFERLVERRRAETEAIVNADIQDERRRTILSPPAFPALRPRQRHARFALPDPPPQPPPNANANAAQPRPRIGFGGAVLRAGDRQINYDRNPDANPNPGGLVGHGRNRAPLALNVRRQIFDDDAYIDDPGDGMRRGRLGALINRLLGEGLGHYLPPRNMAELAAARYAAAQGGAGGAGAIESPQTLAAKADIPTFPSPQPGFTSDFNMDDRAEANAIELDEHGRVVTKPNKPKAESYLACLHCKEPLLLSSAYRSPEDKVWVLRCGHMIDQRCLDKLGQPHSEEDREHIIRHPPEGLPILGEEPEVAGTKRGRSKRARVTRKTAVQPVEYEWKCPVEGCGRVHWSVANKGEWEQPEGLGAMQMYA